MAGDDYNVKIGFDTSSLDKAKKEFQNLPISGGSGGGSKAEKASEGINVVSGGVSKALKITGLIGIISSLAIITDTLGIIVGLFTVFILSGVLAFFKDPVRALIPLGVFIANSIIGGLESLANAIVPGADPFEFGRFKTDLVLTAYDELQTDLEKAKEDGISTFTEVSNAYQEFGGKLLDSFLTDSEYQDLVIKAAEENRTVSSLAFEETGSMLDSIVAGSISVASAAGNAFDRATAAFDDLFSGGGGRESGVSRNYNFETNDGDVNFGLKKNKDTDALLRSLTGG